MSGRSRLAAALLLSGVLAMFHAPPAQAARAVLNGVEIPGAILHENRLFVSLRTFASLVKGRLFWDPVERVARLFLPGRSATVWSERRQALVNSDPVHLDSPPLLRAGVLFVPLAWLAEAAGGSVSWDDAAGVAAALIPWLDEPGPALTPPDPLAGDSPGEAPASATGERPFVYDASPEELNLLARVIAAEAYGEPFRGKVAVGAVVLNRVRDAGGTISSVLRRGCQFTVVCNGAVGRVRAAAEDRRAAEAALRGEDPTDGARYFNAARFARGGFWDRLRSRGWREVRIGGQVFFAPPAR